MVILMCVDRAKILYWIKWAISRQLMCASCALLNVTHLCIHIYNEVTLQTATYSNRQFLAIV